MSSAKKLPLTGVTMGDVPAALLVCGDPKRAARIADRFDERQVLSQRREYHAFLGRFEGMPVAVCSHGIGAPGAAIAFEELIRAGGRRLIRTGTCGALQPGIREGHLVIATAAVSNSGYIDETVPQGYPAVADIGLSSALRQTTIEAGLEHSVGIVLTRDNFYAGVDPPGTPDYDLMSRANVIAVEMECAALFVLGSLRQVQTAAILAVDGNVLESAGETMESYDPGQESVKSAVDNEIDIALKALLLFRDDPG